MKWYLLALQKYAQFEGRSRRQEYWMFILFNFLFSIAASTLDYLLGFGEMGYGAISGLYALAMFIPGIAVLVRRLHDTGKSGWWFFIVFIPFIGFIWLIILLATEGTPGRNEYGRNPKEGSDFGDDSLDSHLL